MRAQHRHFLKLLKRKTECGDRRCSISSTTESIRFIRSAKKDHDFRPSASGVFPIDAVNGGYVAPSSRCWMSSFGRSETKRLRGLSPRTLHTDVFLRGPTYRQNSPAIHTWNPQSHQTGCFKGSDAPPVWVRFPSPAPLPAIAGQRQPTRSLAARHVVRSQTLASIGRGFTRSLVGMTGFDPLPTPANDC